MAVDFPFARSILIVQAHRTEAKRARTSVETRYYLSSLEATERTPAPMAGAGARPLGGRGEP